jgi:NADH:ubiquinone oxidoreductase subunit 5 (subunit L)/multisubunit Na+/H+ antiporter MnhA subunit
LCACFDQNSKKIVAYSTVRQLGLLRYVLSLGLFDLFFFYMMVHALFKALLFISVGGLMLLKVHNQDVRHLRNCWFQKPLISLKLFFRIFALSGFPFLSGFYIKELIINGSDYIKKKLISWFLFFSSIMLTVYYSFRLYKIMLRKYKFNYGVIKKSINIPY